MQDCVYGIMSQNRVAALVHFDDDRTRLFNLLTEASVSQTQYVKGNPGWGSDEEACIAVLLDLLRSGSRAEQKAILGLQNELLDKFLDLIFRVSYIALHSHHDIVT